jgi:hypothetical protein
VKLRAIDESNRSAHYYLTADDKCYYLHEFTARKGYAFSPGNQFIFNFKKSPTKRHEPQYQHKLRAIETAAVWYRSIFSQVKGAYDECTFVPIPPSKVGAHPEYDDRMWQVIQAACKGTGADAREMIQQTQSYEAAHMAGDSVGRIKPAALQALYEVDATPPKSNVLLFDDVLSAGCHFKAAKAAILEKHPKVKVAGFFLARRVLPDPAEDFEVI